MAKITNAFDTYSATSDREQLSNVIYNISPQTTPFMSAIGKNSIKNVVFDWQTESLPTPVGTGNLEGFELSRSASTATVRNSNVAMISKRDATVTGSQQASDPAGKKSEMAHQLAIMSKALKRDMETALCQKGGKTTGNATTARLTGGFESWVKSNVNNAAGSTPTGGGTAPTDGTQRALTEALLKSNLKSCFDQGGNPDLLLVGSFNKQKVSGFTGNSTRMDMAEDRSLVATIDVYVSDFGEVRVVADRILRSSGRTALVVDTEMWAAAFLRPFQVQDLAKTGDAEKKQLLVEYTLVAKNEAANGKIADLTTS